MAAACERLLACDLDGTLHSGDLAAIGSWCLLRRRPWELARLLYWLRRGGRLRLKQELAMRQPLDFATLDWSGDVIEFLRDAAANGQRLALATAAMQAPAAAAAAHLQRAHGLRFDHILHSTPEQNLLGGAKALALEALAGDAGFDYIGDSPRQDPPVFQRAHTCHLVNPTATLRREFATPASRVFQLRTSAVQRLCRRVVSSLQQAGR